MNPETKPPINEVSKQKVQPPAQAVDVSETSNKSLDSNLQTLSQIKSKTSSLVKIGMVLVAILSLTTFVLLILIVNKTKQLTLIQTQLSAKTQDYVAISNASEYLNSNLGEQEIILNALPDESKLIDFVNTIELLSSNYSTKHTLEFSALAPTKIGNNQYIPTMIVISTDPNNFQLFLAGLEKLPYIIEVTSIQSSVISADENIWEYKIASRVYVQNPFKSSN